MSVNNFFNPATIAIIGASNHIKKVGGILMKNALKSNCKIVPINPSHDELFGLKCYKSVLDFKGEIDLAVIVIPKDLVASAIEECGKKGIKEVIIISAGFSEVGNISDEKKVKNIAEKYKIRFIGPNCFGIFSPNKNLDLTFSITTPKKGSIAFISQSGALWSFMSDRFSDVGFSGFVGLGNQADLEFNDFIEYFSEDKNTKSIILYIEKLKNGKKFIEKCKKAIEKGKKIYAVKAGKSEEGKKAAFSHTGSLATDHDIYLGAFNQAGVILCETLVNAVSLASEKKLDTIKIKKLRLENKIRIITNAGGAAALVSDYISEKGFKISESRDLLGTALAIDYKTAINSIQDNSTIIVLLTPQSMTEIKDTARVIAEFNNAGRKIVAVFLGGKSMNDANDIFEKNKIVYFNDFQSFLKSL